MELTVSHWTGEDGQSYAAVGCTDLDAFTTAVRARMETDGWECHAWSRPAVVRLGRCASCEAGLGYNTYWHDLDGDPECDVTGVEDVAIVEVESCDCPPDASEAHRRAAAESALLGGPRPHQVASG